MSAFFFILPNPSIVVGKEIATKNQAGKELGIPPTGGVDEPTTSAPPPCRPPFPECLSTQTPSPPQDDGSEPLNSQGDGILQQPEEVEDHEGERESEEKEGDQGQDTAGPLT